MQNRSHLEKLLHMLAQLLCLTAAVVAGHIALHPTPMQQPWHEGLQPRTKGMVTLHLVLQHNIHVKV